MKTITLLICSAIAVYASPASARAKAKRAKPPVTAPSKAAAPSSGASSETTPASTGAPEASATTGDAASATTAPPPAATSAAMPVASTTERGTAAPSTEPTTTVTAEPTATVASAKADNTPPSSVSTSVSPASSSSGPGAHGIRVGAKVGVAVPTSKLGVTPVFGIDAEYRLPFLDRLLGIAAEFAYSAPSTDGNGTDPATGDFSYKLDTRITSFALEAIARRSFDRFEPYGGAGYSVVLLHDQTTAFAAKTTESQTRAGFQLRGGCGYLIGPGHIFAEARYQFAHFDFEATGSSSAGTFDVFAGYRFAL